MALWHKESIAWIKQVRANEELLLNAERVNQQQKSFYCITSSPTSSFFLSLTLGGVEIMWVLNNFKKKK